MNAAWSSWAGSLTLVLGLLVAFERPAADIATELGGARREVETARRTRAGADQVKQAAKRFCELALELRAAAPEHVDVARGMTDRWALMAVALGEAEAADAEILALVEAEPDSKLAIEARFALIQVRGHVAKTHKTTEALLRAKQAAEQFVIKHPEERRGPDALWLVAELAAVEPKVQLDLYRQVMMRFPSSKRAAEARALIEELEQLGQAFELEFTDAIGGKRISIADLRGKVVVVDFWATWCGPCVRDMPHLKELYAKYKDQGVEFIGVSLDKSEAEGGLAALKNFVDVHKIGWPQYYQGKYWDGAFSSSWGIRKIPRVFLIDHEGKLVTTQAWGRLDSLLPMALEKAKAPR